MTELGIFAKYWEPGKVKTRLARSIGSQAATEVYRAFLDCLLTRCTAVADRQVLAYAPRDRRDEFLRFAPAVSNRWTLQSQGAGGLGERMTAYFQLALRQGADRVVLIGSDSPSLPRSYLVSAIAQLVDHDVVLGRSHDGGYYLVGMSGRHTEIFRGIDWSTDRVWEQTLARTRHCRLRVAELPEFFDVDEFSDLHRLSTELQRHVQDPAAGRRDVQAFAELLAVVQPLVDRAAADTQRERAAE